MVLNQIIPVTNRVPARSQTGLKVCNLVNRHLVYLKGLNVQLHKNTQQRKGSKGEDSAQQRQQRLQEAAL